MLKAWMMVYTMGISTAAVGPYESLDVCQIEAQGRNEAYDKYISEKGYYQTCVTSVDRPYVEKPTPGIGQGE